MRTFAEIYEIASARKGGDAALESLLEPASSAAQLATIPPDRWLAKMA